MGGSHISANVLSTWQKRFRIIRWLNRTMRQKNAGRPEIIAVSDSIEEMPTKETAIIIIIPKETAVKTPRG